MKVAEMVVWKGDETGVLSGRRVAEKLDMSMVDLLANLMAGKRGSTTVEILAAKLVTLSAVSTAVAKAF